MGSHVARIPGLGGCILCSLAACFILLSRRRYYAVRLLWTYTTWFSTCTRWENVPNTSLTVRYNFIEHRRITWGGPRAPWHLAWASPELPMGWVDQWVWLGCVGLGRDFSAFRGLGWVQYSKSTKIWKDYVNAFKARLDKIWLHQAVKLLKLYWVGLGPDFSTCSGLCCVSQLMDWVGSGHTEWTRGL